MTTPSPKMGLALPAQTDQFSTLDVRTNWEKIDATPGTHICTSTTRPAWSAAQAGRKILETNTGLEWWWTGTAWSRLGGTGLLKRSDGTFAIGERTTDFTTTSQTSFVRVVSLTNVVIPAGNRPIRVDVSWQVALNDAGNFSGAIFRSNTNDSGPKMAQWNFAASAAANNVGGGVYWAVERSGVPAGTYDFSFQINAANGGTSTIRATTTTPTTVMVTEL